MKTDCPQHNSLSQRSQSDRHILDLKEPSSNCSFYIFSNIQIHRVCQLKLCLFHMDGVDLKPYLNDLEELEKVMKEWIFKKPKEHHFEEEHSSTVMNEIGG